MNNQRAQGGFTLIELVIVIVILGILAAVAVPRYLDLTADAQDASCQGVQGGLMSSAAILVAQNKAPTASGLDIINATTLSPATATASGCTITVDLDGDTATTGDTCTAFTVPTSLCTP